MSGSFESVRWNAYVHRLDLGLYFHPKEFWGNGVRTHVNSKGKIPSTGGSEEDGTRDAASGSTASPTHYRLSYSGPRVHSDMFLLLVVGKGSQRQVAHQNELGLLSEVEFGSQASLCTVACPSPVQLPVGPEVWGTTGGHAPLFVSPEVWGTAEGHAPLFAGPEVWGTAEGHAPLFVSPEVWGTAEGHAPQFGRQSRSIH